MQASEFSRAVAATMSTASALDLTVDDAIVLHDSNKLALRLLPCEVFARVAPVAHQVAQFEVELAQRLAETESPVAALEPRVEPRVYERDGFVLAEGAANFSTLMLLEHANKKGLPDLLEALENVLVAGACNQRYLQLWSEAA